MSNQFKDTISLQEAETITANWRNYIGKYEPQSQYIRAFNIPMEDITQLAGFAGECPSVRAYLAMTEPGNIATLKVIIVPVDEKNQDIVSQLDPGGSVVESTIFDFSSPCPQMCDINSPLFGQ